MSKPKIVMDPPDRAKDLHGDGLSLWTHRAAKGKQNNIQFKDHPPIADVTPITGWRTNLQLQNRVGHAIRKLQSELRCGATPERRAVIEGKLAIKAKFLEHLRAERHAQLERGGR
jgi:hypothetical protein